MQFSHAPKWGPSGEMVYNRTYSRTKFNGEKETWEDTVNRVVDGNIALVDPSNIEHNEASRLKELMYDFRVLPAGRHLWASGVKGRQYLYNCFVSGWDKETPVSHFTFTFMQLMCGGGVGANYSNHYLENYPTVIKPLNVHIVCSSTHADYEILKPYLSATYSADWEGAYAIEDSREGWSDALQDLLGDFFHDDVAHADRVYDVSRVRPSGAPLRGFGGSASGPAPLARMLKHIGTVLSEEAGGQMSGMIAMDIDHEIAQCVVSGGVRRSARMSIMHWMDSEIFSFIGCKDETGDLWTTNISVEIDDKFFSALAAGDSHAEEVMQRVSAGMLKNGEPGFWNSSLSSVGEVDPIVATNPCGEIPLESWGGCNLGHVNMDAFSPTEYGGDWDILGASEAHRLMTRYLIRATYADLDDEKNRTAVNRSRRIGVGHFGVQGFFAKQNIKFSEAPDSQPMRDLRTLHAVVRDEARRYAFQLRIPEPVKTTTVAPTGTIAKLAGRTEGIHPIYARYFIRRVRFSNHDPAQISTVEQHRTEGYDVEPCQYAPDTTVVSFPTQDALVAEVVAMGYDANVVESADEISLRDQLRFQAAYQHYYADNAVSFTANVNPGDITSDNMSETLAEFLPYLKGTTVFPDKSRPQSPYSRISQAEYELYETWLRGVDSGDEACKNGVCPIK